FRSREKPHRPVCFRDTDRPDEAAAVRLFLYQLEDVLTVNHIMKFRVSVNDPVSFIVSRRLLRSVTGTDWHGRRRIPEKDRSLDMGIGIFVAMPQVGVVQKTAGPYHAQPAGFRIPGIRNGT